MLKNKQCWVTVDGHEGFEVPANWQEELVVCSAVTHRLSDLEGFA